MSAGEAGIAVLYKPLMALLGGFALIIKGLLIYIWVTMVKKNNKTKNDLDNFKNEVSRDYYNKESVDLIVAPIDKTLERFVNVTEELKEEITQLRIQNAKHAEQRRD